MSYSFSEINALKIYPNYGLNSFGAPLQKPVAFSQNAQDTFETNDKVSFTGKTKRNVLLATGGALAIGSVAFLLNRRMTLEKAQKIFQNTFMNNDITIEDTSKIIAEFKEISKIENITDYIKALFDSAQKYYGLSHLNTKLEIVDLPSKKLGAMDPSGMLSISKNAKRSDIVNIIFHEFRHAKQNDIMATSDFERYVQGVLNRNTTNEVLRGTKKFKLLLENMENPFNLPQNELEELVLDYMKSAMKKASLEQFKEFGYGLAELPKLNNLSEYIEKCFKAHSNYDGENVFAYFFNFLEKDAREAASGICDVFNNLSKL
jgi:hypothetical protein